jgi:hypothetical protein
MTSCHCCATGRNFDQRTLLAAAEQAALAEQATRLGIGGGIGAIHHPPLNRGFSRATQLDASPACLDAAADEAARLGAGPPWGAELFGHAA